MPSDHDPTFCVLCRSGEHASPDEPAQFDDIHTFFGLTYANYLVMHRSGLQSMPDRWQVEFVALLEEYYATVRDRYDGELPDMFRVQPVDENGKFKRDPVPPYNRGRTRLWSDAGVS